MNIRWGKMITDLSDVERASADGFDQVQPMVRYFMGLNDEQYALAGEHFQQSGLGPEICSSPLPAEVVVAQAGFNIYVWTEYLKKAVQRVAGLGCKKIVWSDGRARALPLEGDKSEVKSQVLQFLYMLCEIADNFGITILVEPLGPRRTNFLNSMDELIDVLPLVGKENCSVLISLRELAEIGLDVNNLNTYTPYISHVQMENPLEQRGPRRSPRPGDGFDYRPFLRGLHLISYDGVITLPEDADHISLQYCRGLWDEIKQSKP